MFYDFNLIEQLEKDNASNFIENHLADAQTVQDVYGIDFRIPLTVSALETGWGTSVKHNNYFGIKYAKGMEKQLITTTEYLDTPNAKFHDVISVTKVGNKYKYIVKDWFSVYPTPYDSFKGYYLFLEENPRYKTALKYKKEPLKFFEEVAKAGYATAPNYAEILKQVFNSVSKRL